MIWHLSEGHKRKKKTGTIKHDSSISEIYKSHNGNSKFQGNYVTISLAIHKKVMSYLLIVSP